MMESTTFMPLEGNELEDLQFFHSLYRCVSRADSLQKRLRSVNLWWRYRGVLKQLHNMFDAVWNTIDPATRNRINQVWSQQELRIVNTNAPVDTSGDLMMVPKSVVMYMAQQLQSDACGMCLGGHNDRKDCKFRRAMIDLAIPDLRREEKRSGKCVGHIFKWG